MTAEISEAVEQLRDTPDVNDILTDVVEQQQLTMEQLRSNEKRFVEMERMLLANTQLLEPEPEPEPEPERF